jgi:hypothetical protein
MDKLINNRENDGGLAALFNPNGSDVKLFKATNPAYDPEAPVGPDGTESQTPDKSGSSPNTVYYSWLSDYGYMAEEEAED